MRLNQGTIYYAELFLCLVFVVLSTSYTYLFFLWKFESLSELLLLTSSFSYIILYALKKPAGAAHGGKRYSLLLNALFLCSAVFYVGTFLSGPAISLLYSETGQLFYAAVFLVFFILAFFLAFMGCYLIKRKEPSVTRFLRRNKISFALFAILLLILLIFFSQNVVSFSKSNDEEFLMLQGVKLLLKGLNPYAVSVANSLYSNITAKNVTGASVTTANEIIGVFDYPALFLLSFIPFYFLSAPTVSNFGAIDLPAQAGVFLFVLLLVIGFSIDRKELLKPNLLLIAFFVLFVLRIASVTTYLMSALLILAYFKLDSKYAWLYLGLCVSLQEELWLPALFLLAYSMNHDWRKGLRNLAGAALVFLVVNSYFIALSPSVFVKSVFTPLSAPFLPIAPSPFSFLLLKYYPIAPSAYSSLFLISTAILLLALLWTDEKKLIPIFSLLPLLTAAHVIMPYYSFFLFISLLVANNEKEGSITYTSSLLKERRYVFYFLLAVLIAAGAFEVLASHAAYESAFKISIGNQRLLLNWNNSTTSYRGTLSYSGLQNGTVYMLAISYNGSAEWVAGLFNSSLIGNKPSCSSYACEINVNRIDLIPGSVPGAYALNASIGWFNNTEYVRRIAIAIYNKGYFYAADSVYNASSKPGSQSAMATTKVNSD